MVADVEGTSTSLAQSAYVAIREGIIHGVHPPGSRLRERSLSEDLNVSRVPIREALRQLELEGYVTTSPHRGALVRQLTLRDVAELFDVRLSLEVLAARQAARAVAEGRADDALRDVLAEAARATRAGDEDAIRQANTNLHAQIIAMTGNSLLIATMTPLLGRIRWLFALTADRDPHVEYGEHVALCDAIYSGNAELAGALAFAHIEHGRAPSLRGLAAILPAD
ncbi:Transcriptional regulator, GntR family [Pseudonocardia sp. Ae406_Ps2]|uniref:GntR family transcriptional regulator n=1 Tax=unclassified Pseudonocardia TaxID=2619320 RepID=UPI000303396F|nr:MULTISPECIES: GntR family transcriptional regulator [unclassified Pseudonocardia]OLL98659.1 Transcriptional regulator, GntR family [Pseudonocardia sp. Ae331_Ps2]OLM03612.1 Transcriptional regulator, GntR family [Pseudonocardia sp. Ae406_Ps2]OLM11526.1 Transcriptional regulator, GntR family [Pseudonocardia sp. Ae505_Ps2]OLM25171.1 Transcriptional regulator, GntR family [Pseudonocardia sp. Ae706_Ps2]OLM34625.1 Transcriptional regulator, GntR family [Pseudonocardia sp. Ae717_Ps2]